MRNEPRDQICLMISKNPEDRGLRVDQDGETCGPEFAGAERAVHEEGQPQERKWSPSSQAFIPYLVILIKWYLNFGVLAWGK